MQLERSIDEKFSQLDPDYVDARDFVLHVFWNAYEKWEHSGNDEYILKAIEMLNGLPKEDKEFVISNAVRWSRKFRDELKKLGVEVPEERHGHAVK